MKHIVNCSQCDKKIEISSQRFNKNKNNFCSKRCEGKHRVKNCSSKILIKCNICEKDIRLKKSAYEKRKNKNEITCSKKCMG